MPEDRGADPGADRAEDAEETARLELPSLSGLFRRRKKSSRASRPGDDGAGDEGSEVEASVEAGTADEASVGARTADEPVRSPSPSAASRVRPSEQPSEPEPQVDLTPEPEPEPARGAEPEPEAEPEGEREPQPEPEPEPEDSVEAETEDPPSRDDHEWEPARPEDTEPIQATPVPPVIEDDPEPDAPQPEPDVSQAEPDASPVEKTARTLTLPTVGPLTAAALTGVAVGLLGVVLTYASTRGCEAVRGVGSCGGAGIVLLVAILGLMVLLGHVLMAAWRLSDTLSTSFLGVAIVAVVVMLFLLSQTDRWWMAIVLPLIAAAAYAGSWWGTSRFGPSSG